MVRPWSERRLHFVGIGGCGMSAVALVAQARGAQVSGCDRAEGPYLERLRARGIAVAVGAPGTTVPEAEGIELVVSSAIPFEDADRAAGRLRSLPEHHRMDLLVELVQGQRTLAVAGTHGKTTTAAMIVHALRGAGRPVDYVIGGDLLSSGLNAEWDGSEWVVIETDESDRSLLQLVPDLAVLTNVDWDHVETFESLAAVEAVFRQFLAPVKQVVLEDRPEVLALRRGPCLPVSPPASQVRDCGSRFKWDGHDVELSVPGRHNVLNAAAALRAVDAVGADLELAAKVMNDFPGVARRFEALGRLGAGSFLYDDYAHHPAEVRATLSAARTLSPRRLLAVLRPWGMARTAAMAQAYGEALALADAGFVLDVADGSFDEMSRRRAAAAIVEAAVRCTPATSARSIAGPDAVVDALRSELGPGAICVTIGCRDVAELLRSPSGPLAEHQGGE